MKTVIHKFPGRGKSSSKMMKKNYPIVKISGIYS